MAAAVLDRALDDQLGDLGPATAVAAGLIAAALVANAWLIWAGHEPLTALARSPRGRQFRRYCEDHFDQLLLLDLFSLGGTAVTRLQRRSLHR